ncbi:hypothetical protein RRF57_002015 [Xylaria bambusicola]|uniref:Uncharacterized protein n=1 Tax=Xylaria bambusicola TaxID=326684 RepID=A0AAN7YVB2_9PEZI
MDDKANIAPTGTTSMKTTSTDDTSIEGNNTHDKQVRNNRLPGLLIGVETDAQLAMAKRSMGETLDELARLFRSQGLDAYMVPYRYQAQDYLGWCITIDPSLEGSGIEYPGRGVEIKTPIINIGNLGYKHGIQIITKYEVLEVGQHTQHPESLPFASFISKKQSTTLCQAYLTSMTGCAHKAGKNNRHYARRNRVRPKYNRNRPPDDLRSCWECIRSTENTHGYSSDEMQTFSGGERLYKWNFTGVGNIFRTIEFRQRISCVILLELGSHKEYITHHNAVPPCRSAEETLDWIGFLTAFLAAVQKVDTTRLDQAALPQLGIIFAKALGHDLHLTLQAERQYEAEWAAGSPPYRLCHLHLRDVVGHNFDFWPRLSAVKYKIESGLLGVVNE